MIHMFLHDCLQKIFSSSFKIDFHFFRAFFIAIFRHIHYVGARACHRTALEFCKLALSLDPLEDPLGILLLMDFYAIRAQQYSWFLGIFQLRFE